MVKENYRRFACTKCEFSISKIPGGRQFEIAGSRGTAEEQDDRAAVGLPHQDGPAVRGDPEARRSTTKSTTTSSNSTSARTTGGEDGEAVDFSDQTAARRVPEVQAAACTSMGMSYVCENTVANPKTCDFRSRQGHPAAGNRAASRWPSCSNEGKTDLLTNFMSRARGRNVQGLPGQAARTARSASSSRRRSRRRRLPRRPRRPRRRPTAASESESEDDEATVAVKAAPAAKKAAAKTRSQDGGGQESARQEGGGAQNRLVIRTGCRKKIRFRLASSGLAMKKARSHNVTAPFCLSAGKRLAAAFPA